MYPFTWMYLISLWKVQIFLTKAQQGRLGGWFLQAAGRTLWGREGYWLTNWPGEIKCLKIEKRMKYINLFPTVWRKIKYEHCEKRNAHTWYDKIHCVKKGLPPHCDVESNVQIRLITAGVELYISENEKNHNL